MPAVQVFFDYTCPFCRRAHGYYRELLPDFPEIRLEWRPVEAHPRTEEPWYNPHVDLAVQGALFVKDRGGDEPAYHERIIDAHFKERRAVDDIEVLAECAGELGLPAGEFRAALTQGTYAARQLEANAYAYEKNKVWALPTLICGDKRLDAVEGIGVSKEQVRTFFEACGA